MGTDETLSTVGYNARTLFPCVKADVWALRRLAEAGEQHLGITSLPTEVQTKQLPKERQKSILTKGCDRYFYPKRVVNSLSIFTKKTQTINT